MWIYSYLKMKSLKKRKWENEICAGEYIRLWISPTLPVLMLGSFVLWIFLVSILSSSFMDPLFKFPLFISSSFASKKAYLSPT